MGHEPGQQPCVLVDSFMIYTLQQLQYVGTRKQTRQRKRKRNTAKAHAAMSKASLKYVPSQEHKLPTSTTDSLQAVGYPIPSAEQSVQ